MRVKKLFLLIILLFVTAVLTQSCDVGGYGGLGFGYPGYGLYPGGGIIFGKNQNQESIKHADKISFLIPLGAQLNNEIVKNSNVLNNPTVQNYIDSLGKTLAANTGRSDISFKFTVLKDKNINAFAMPGGFIYITTGLLETISTEGELAAVLAHEISHIVLKHSLCEVKNRFGQDLSLDYTGNPQNFSADTPVFSIAQCALMQRFNCEEETKVDELSAALLSRAGYSPSVIIKILELQQKVQQNKMLSNFCASHPCDENRISNIKNYISQNNLDKQGLITDKAIFKQVKRFL